MNIAIIPARGGSKRIPRKNIVDFFGKPMIAWAIQAALESECFDRVVVSTDSPEIADAAAKYGCEVPFLRQSAVDDYSPVSLATIAAVGQASDFYKEEYDVVAQVMPNCPFRDAKDIKAAMKKFSEKVSPFQISCFPFGFMNPLWALKMDQDGRGKFLFKEASRKRSQDLEALYCPTGAIWIAETKKLIKAQTFYGPGLRFFPLSWISGLDIDNFDDLEMARAIFTWKNKDNNTQNE